MQEHTKRTRSPAGRRIRCILLIAVFSLMVLGMASCRTAGLKVTPTDMENKEVSPISSFLISANGSPTVEELRDEIVLEPNLLFDLRQDEENPKQFILKPLQTLEAGSDLTISVRGKKFSFQIQNVLLVLSHFPSDEAELVPIGSGIEFEFNDSNLSLYELGEAFDISPDVDGQFSLGDGRYVFYPERSMEYDTLYTVTLSDTLTGSNGAALASEISFTFHTISRDDEEAYSKFQLSGRNLTHNCLSFETPLVQVYIESGAGGETSDVEFKLHQFENWQDYRDLLSESVGQSRYYNYSTAIDTTNLEEYASFTLNPFRFSEDSDSYYTRDLWILQFPEALPEGWYTVDMTMQVGTVPVTRQFFLQISDLSIFYMNMGHNMIVWANDAATGQPISDARFTVNGGAIAAGTTGADGTAVIDTLMQVLNEDGAQVTSQGIFTLEAGDRVFVDGGSYSDNTYDLVAKQYSTYLFTDRPIYHTTDTVQVWGVVRPRDPATTPIPETVTLNFGDDMAVVEVTPNANGTFTASLPFQNMAANYWTNLSLIYEEETLRSTYLRVEDFVKPIYTASSGPEKPVYLLNESRSGKLNLDVSLFDGTPASSFLVRVSSWNEAISLPRDTDLTTNSLGHLDVPIQFNEQVNTWYPQSYPYQFSSTDAEAENFYQYGNIYAIHRDLMLDGKVTVGKTDTTLEVTTHNIDISGVEETADLWQRDKLRGNALNKSVTAEVHRVYYTKEQTGVHYDFINRQSVQSYRYVRHDDIEDTISFTTENGAYTLTGLPKSDNESCYYVNLRSTDSLGQTVEITAYLGSFYERGYSGDDGTHRFVLAKESDPEGSELAANVGTGEYYNYRSEGYSFGDGDTTTFVLTDNDNIVEEFSGTLMYSIVQDDFTQPQFSRDGRVVLPFAESLLPNYVITGAYFDGTRMYKLEDTGMQFDPERRELEITLEPSQETYKPADTMQVTATVTNKVTGLPASGASLVLAVVDEAVFALQEQSIDILETMYRPVYYPYVNKYVSYTQGNYGAGGEKGGGGGDEGQMRVDFEDTAHFSTATTGADGKASFSFKLPDNITSWRLTCLALTENNHAGSARTKAAATLEFFLNPIVNDVILDGDSFTVGLRGAGIGVADTDEVAYTVTVAGNGVNRTETVTSAVKTLGTASFNDLSRGEYTVTVTGKTGDYTDSIQLPFEVVASGIELTLVKTFDLSSGIQVDPLRYPVSIAFYDPAWHEFNRVFSSVMQSSYGARADMRLARKFIAAWYEDHGDSWYNSYLGEESIRDLTEGSLMQLFPYSDMDVELTVLAKLALPDMVPDGSLAYISPDEDWFTGTKSSIWLGRALTGRDHEINPDRMLENNTDLDFVDKMYLCLALAVSEDPDDIATAIKWYDELVTPRMNELTGVSGDKALYIDPPDSHRSQADCTAAASLLASVLGTEEADGLVRYLVDKKSKYEPYLLEQMVYLRYFNPEETGETAQFRYMRDGKEVTQELTGGTVYLTFTKDQLDSAQFQVLSGSVSADVYYAGSLEEQADDSGRLIGFTKTVEAVDGTMSPGSLVKITLTPDLAGLDLDVGSAQMIIDDYIPSGMRFERYEFNQDYGYGWHLYSRQGQRVQFCAWGSKLPGGLEPIVYYARCATPGEYVVESAHISSNTSDTWGATDRAVVVIE